MKAFLLSCLLLCGAFAGAQPVLSPVRGTVIDSASQEPCSYVRIYNLTQKIGVLTEYTGRFEILAGSGDTISFNSPGYKERFIAASDLFSGDSVVFLQPEGSVLDELIVLATDRHLYRWMDEVFAEKTADRKAKTYMEVETFLDQTQVELVEAYYNGTIRGCDVRSLQFKNGRMALAKTDNTSFISTETSKAILELRLNSGDDYLPDSPFEYPVKKMRKVFRLTLNKTYHSAKGHAIYIISFEPRQKDANAFSGTIWLDTVTKKALKLSLNAKPARVHPFMPIFPHDSIVSVNLEINYAFSESAKEQQLDFIYFNYALDYMNRDRDHYAVETNVIVHPYSYDSAFIPPHFQRHEARHTDYLNILAFPYNADFWNLEEHPVSQEIEESNKQFFDNRDVVYNSDSITTFQINNGNDHGFFQSPYRFWNARRVIIIDTLPPPELPTKPSAMRYAQPASQLYELSAQIYVDVNYFDGQPHILTATVLDPFKTFYKLPRDSTTDCFLNLYMDIVEIERRKFVKKVTDPSFQTANLDAAYAKLQSDVDAVTLLFFREVNHGTARRGMEKWNEYVMKELGIDNFRAFRLYKEGGG